MSITKISLPNSIIADLYKESIVLIESDLNSIAENQKTLAFLGSNQKNICIVVKDESAIHLQDDLLEILSAILSACKLNLADVAIVNTFSQTVTDNVLRAELSPKMVLLFGVETTAVDLPFSIPLYKPQPFNNCTYLQAAPLEKMKGNSTEAKLEKSKLWMCLKNIFGI